MNGAKNLKNRLFDASASLERMEELFSVLPDRRMRDHRFFEEIQELDDEAVSELLETIYLAAIRKSVFAASMLESLVQEEDLQRAFGRERLSSIYQAADRAGHTLATEFLCPMPSPRLREPIKEGHRDLAKLTLGEKRALARGCASPLIEKLIVEPEPLVIRNLLNHPHLNVHQVLQISSRTPNFPEILMEIFYNRRWSNRYEVRKSLLQNPYSPPRLVMALLPWLTEQDVLSLKNGKRFSHAFLDRIISAMKTQD